MSGDYDPVKWADVVTTTTHKTLRGPRGGMVLVKEEFADAIDKGCPMILGGPLPHILAAKAVSFAEALDPSFKTYGQQIIKNSKALAAACIDEGIVVATGGSDNHLMLLDVRPFGLNGRQAETALRECGVTLNRNALPFDPNGPWYTSGLRIGTPAITTLGMKEEEMKEVAAIIKLVLENTKPTIITKGERSGEQSLARAVTTKEARDEARKRVQALLDRFVLYPELDLELMRAYRQQ
jgi:glycine hydroxymethyltransferase